MPETRSKQPAIDLNDQFRHALHVMEETDRSVFITGRAGTGKSTLLTYFRGLTRKRVAVLAPTGVAALNVKGQTIHSFFRFKPGITLEQVRKRVKDEKKSVYTRLDAIVIDEISMVRADLLDCVDKFLRLNGPCSDEPFGGIQMVFIGDLYQLPPVVTGAEREIFRTLYQTPYFYSARVFDAFEMEFIELEKVYRQQDADFISLLNSIRNNSITPEALTLLNRRVKPDFEPPPDQFYLCLTTTNAMAEEVNMRRLAALPGRASAFAGIVAGDFGKEYLPTAIDLGVKAGAQIMMVNNDTAGRWVNGSIGKVLHIEKDGGTTPIIIAELADGEEVDISPFTWEISRFYAQGPQLLSEVVGTFTQYPLMLAWAVTIHKSQGKTFDRVVIDIGKGAFAHGQTYVALSRCTTLEGIVLKKPILKQHIWTDREVVKFLTKYQYRRADELQPVAGKVEMIERAIESRARLRIVYLKPNDEKSARTIQPREVGEMEYQGKTYTGVRAFCFTRGAERVFRVDRILAMEEDSTR